MSEQEKFRTLIKWVNKCKIVPVDTKLLEIGCGNGLNILYFMQLGFQPKNIAVNELIESRLIQAKEILPSYVTFYPGNAINMAIKSGSFDIVSQSMVFSSILNKNFRAELAEKMWDWVKPGGGVLWYDFIYNNPFNKDVEGIPVSDVFKLFPGSEYFKWKITLAPPLSRLVAGIHPFLYTIFSKMRIPRTHYLIYIKKN
jgi:SAM-dependent methyltransferase